MGDLVFLIWGGDGWIAGHLWELLQKTSHQVHKTTVRLEKREAVISELDRIRPTHVLNCAGVTGRPNVDWCEDNKTATLRSNVIGFLNLVDCCHERNVHCTMFSTGCIYTYDSTHPMFSGIGFTEDDNPNFAGSYYSFVKAQAELLVKSAYLDNTLILRLRMPVSDDLHPRSFVTKIISYPAVVDIPNSHSILHDLLPCSIRLATERVTGIFNFTNPGAISHNSVLTMYKDMVNPSFHWKNFSLQEQAQVIKAERSNCQLDSSKLVDQMRSFGMEIPEIHQAYKACFSRMVKNAERASGSRL